MALQRGSGVLRSCSEWPGLAAVVALAARDDRVAVTLGAMPAGVEAAKDAA